MAEANLLLTYWDHVLHCSHWLLKIHLQAVNETLFIVSPVLQVS